MMRPPDPALQRSQQPVSSLLLLVLATASVALVMSLPRWFDPALSAPSGNVWVANAWPLLLLWLLIWALVRRPVTAAALVGILAVAFYSANQIKLQNLELPLVPSDLMAVGQIVTSTELFLRYLSFNVLYVLLPIAIFVLWRYEPVPNTRMRWVRASAAIFAILMLAGIPRGWPPSAAIYSQARLATSVWLPQQAVTEVGVIALFAKLAQSTLQGPSAADPAVLAEFEQQFGPARDALLNADRSDELPDLIIVQSESFFDPGRLRGIDGADFIPNFRRLAARSLHGEVRVPTYGGLTTRTEFELLTAIPLATMPGVQYPYQGLVHRPVHALPWVLKSMGYTARAVHPYDRRFYRRDLVYPLLGFDSFHSFSEFSASDVHGYYVSDAAVSRRIIELLDSDGPQMVLAVTMENHGPWNAGRPLPQEALDRIEVPASLAPEEAHQLRAFLHHTLSADAALGELADWASARDKPTLLLFFGDHLPSLTEVFARLGFVDGQTGSRQPLPWLLFDNRQDRNETMNLHAHQLAPVLLDTAGINQDRYFSAASALRAAGSGLTNADRMRMQTHLARESFFANVNAQERVISEGHIAAARAWGPKGGEVAATRDGDGSGTTFWVQFEQPPPRGTYLRLGGRNLDVTRISELRLNGRVSDTLSAGLFASASRLRLEAVDPIAAVAQLIGEVEIRSRAERAKLADGRTSQRLCAIDGWGPNRSPRDGSANLQPSGNLGIWLRGECMPPRARIAFGDLLLDTIVADRVATAGIKPALLERGGEIAIRLFDPDADEWLDVGSLTITD